MKNRGEGEPLTRVCTGYTPTAVGVPLMAVTT